jgi:hypothetical protein
MPAHPFWGVLKKIPEGKKLSGIFLDLHDKKTS